MSRLATCALLALASTGCVSIVSVEKATPASTGVRFNLPEVFIQVTPKADGTMEVKKLFLADPRQEYVVNTTSLFGNYTIDVERGDNNLLSQVTFDADTSAVAKQLVTSAAAVRTARMEAAAARAKAEADEARAAEARMAAVTRARDDAKVAQDVAEARASLLRSRPGGRTPAHEEQALAADLAAAEAKVRFEAARQAADEAAARQGAARKPRGGAFPQAPEPVFYRVEMKPGTVILREAFPQEHRDTWHPPTDPPK